MYLKGVSPEIRLSLRPSPYEGFQLSGEELARYQAERDMRPAAARLLCNHATSVKLIGHRNSESADEVGTVVLRNGPLGHLVDGQVYGGEQTGLVDDTKIKRRILHCQMTPPLLCGLKWQITLFSPRRIGTSGHCANSKLRGRPATASKAPYRCYILIVSCHRLSPSSKVLGHRAACESV